MRYLPIVILALLIVGFIAGCQSNPTPVPPGGGEPAGTSTDSSTVASEAGSAVDSIILDDTDAVEIGEMI